MRISSKKATRAALRHSAVAALGLAVCGSAWALSLGRIVLHSGRGEPLRAEVEIGAISTEEAGSLSAAIAPAEAYRRAGVSLSPALAEAGVSLVQRSDGRQVLRISSLQPVQDEFLDLILEINWASGALTREYTLLFEAPKATAQEPAPAAAAPLLGPAPTPSLPAVTGTPAEAAAPEPSPAPRTPAAAQAPADRYTVRRGDTLSGVAARMARQGVSLDQMLVALYRGNPHAFINKNMNLLRADAVLHLPSAQEAAQVARTEARQVVRMQSADFEAYRERLAGKAPAARVEESARRSGGAVEAAVEDRQTAPAAPDRLRLSRTQGSSPEAALSREAERRDQAQRVAELSRNVEELRRLAANSSNAAAAAAPDAASVPSALGLPVPGAPGAPAASAPAAPFLSASDAAVSIVPDLAASAAAAASGAMEAASAVDEAAAAAAALAAASAASAVEVPPPQLEAANGLSSLARNWWMALAGVLGALVVGGAGVMLLRKRKKAAAETSFLESRLQPDSFFGGHSAQPAGAGAAAQPIASEQYSLSQLDAIGDVDPVAEADVYLAYGRDLQAEEILKEAMRSNPQRLSIRTKLLEVYAKRQDVKAFELLAQQLQQITQGEGEEWARARELGQQIDPGNVLYDEAAAAAKRAPDTMSPSTWPEDMAAPAPAPAPAAAPPAERLDLDLDQLATAPAQSLEQTRPVVTNLERPEPALAPAPAVAPAAAAVAATAAAATSAAAVAAVSAFEAQPVTELQAEDDDSVSLDFGPSAPPRVPTPTVPSEGAPALPFDLDSLSLDLDEPSTASVLSELNLSGFDEEEADPLQRKLDLAEEFRQIGENDAARDLLQEVVAKASGDVKTRAQSMLDSLV